MTRRHSCRLRPGPRRWPPIRSGACDAADESKNNRPLVGSIGLGGQGTGIARRASKYGDVVAVCDVQRQHAERAKNEHFKHAEIFEDYRKLLDRKDIEAVTIGTPDHWHTAIALAALEAGKHVYCEKPLTLTIDEGKQLVAAVKKSGKVMQVGTQQRGDQFELFGRAVATARSGTPRQAAANHRQPAALDRRFLKGQTFEDK